MKTLLILLTNTLIIAGLSNLHAQTLSSSPTLSFRSITGFGDNIAQDGEGGSVAITDINIQALPINNSGTILHSDPLEYHDMLDWGVPAMITYGGTNSFYGWSFRSDNGADFSLVSFDFNDWGSWAGNTITVQAFRDGASLGTVSVPGNTDNNMVHVTSPGILTSIFQKVDEVRIYRQSGAPSWLGINSIKVSSPITTTLPVSWISFTASRVAEGNTVSWSTAKEENSKDYLLQHSVNGADWNNIALVPAHRNSNTIQQYSYLHNTPGGLHYYRIIQRDMDGRQAYSKVVAVKGPGTQNALTLYPNPVVNGHLVAEVQREGKFLLFNAAGCLVFQKQLQPGVHHLQLPRLPKGIYTASTGAEKQNLIIE